MVTPERQKQFTTSVQHYCRPAHIAALLQYVVELRTVDRVMRMKDLSNFGYRKQ